MILYHGSSVVVQKPDIIHSRERVDFGKGFYLTDIPEQAADGVSGLFDWGNQE